MYKMHTEEEIINKIQLFENKAGKLALAINSYKDFGNIAELIFIDGYVSALKSVLNKEKEV